MILVWRPIPLPLASDPKSVSDQAIALYRRGELAEALALLDAALQDRTEPRLLVLKANFLQAAKRSSDAMTALDQALALTPDLAEAWSVKGDLFSDEQRFDQALENYDRALALKPDFAESWYNRGIALRGLGRAMAKRRKISPAPPPPGRIISRPGTIAAWR